MRNDNYVQLLTEIKEKVQEAQLKTVIAANSQMLLLYWHLGNFILENQNTEGWGSKIIDRLSADLKKEFPKIKGFSTRNLKYMRSFASSYSFDVLCKMNELEPVYKNAVSKVQQAVALLENVSTHSPAIVQQAVGILLCKGKNEVLAEYALKGYNNAIGISDYQISKAIPEELKSSLPQIEDLEQELKSNNC